MPNFSQIGQKIREAQILTWNDTENCLMTSYLPHSDDVIKILLILGDFVPLYHHAKFGGNWITNRKNRVGAQCPPAYMVPNDPSLNRVKLQSAKQNLYLAAKLFIDNCGKNVLSHCKF